VCAAWLALSHALIEGAAAAGKGAAASATLGGSAAGNGTLVLYAVPDPWDPFQLANLRHFVAATLYPERAPPGPAGGGPVSYAFLLPEAAGPGGGAAAAAGPPALPRLPEGAGARYVFGAPACAHGWAAAGWYLRRRGPEAEAADAAAAAAPGAHAAYVLLSASMAGPFLPRYAEASSGAGVSVPSGRARRGGGGESASTPAPCMAAPRGPATAAAAAAASPTRGPDTPLPAGARALARPLPTQAAVRRGARVAIDKLRRHARGGRRRRAGPERRGQRRD
jgi:hypothetical protein